MRSILNNISNVFIAIDEVISYYSINRVLKMLFENDVKLNELYASIFGKISITEYNSSVKYAAEDIVWFKDRTNKLWLLKCIMSDNTSSPQLAIDDVESYEYGNPAFEKYGWKDQNETLNIVKLGLKKRLQQTIQNSLAIHQSEIDNDVVANIYHRFGKTPNIQSMDKKILKRDLSNLSISRNKVFFPSLTGFFTTSSVLYGTYRVWDNGLLEFDIVYRLGYQKDDVDGTIVLKCNDVKIQNSPTSSKTSLQYNENVKYFYSADDMSIFSNSNDNYSLIDNMKQTNRNSFVNVYSADIQFPKIQYQNEIIYGFADINYMIFQSNIMCQDELNQHNAMRSSTNQISFVNKSRVKFTPLLITTAQNKTINTNYDFARDAGIVANSFSCHVVGRWK